jgi:hypothetical protein
MMMAKRTASFSLRIIYSSKVSSKLRRLMPDLLVQAEEI